MPLAIFFFFSSLAGLVALIVLKMFDLRRGASGFLGRFFTRFDAPVSRFLTRVSVVTRTTSIFLWQQLAMLSRSIHHVVAAYVHYLLQLAERRVRKWREFAREQKIERGSASGFIKDVTEYKNQLKQSGHQL